MRIVWRRRREGVKKCCDLVIVACGMHTLLCSESFCYFNFMGKMFHERKEDRKLVLLAILLVLDGFI